MTVRDVMTADVTAVEPDASLKEVAAILVERRISGLPVVDGEGRVLGVVSEGDIVQKEASSACRWSPAGSSPASSAVPTS